MDFNLRRIWIEAKTVSGSTGTLTIYQYEDGKLAASETKTTTIYEAVITKEFMVKEIDMSRPRITSFQLKIIQR